MFHGKPYKGHGLCFMKKIRASVTRGSNGKKFHIFNSPESLYVWLNDPELKEASRLDPSLGTTIMLRPGETMEVEWMGCEYINEDNYTLRVDEVRLAKTIKIDQPKLKINNIVGIHSGWTSDHIISFNNNSDDDVKITRLSNKSKQKFDIEALFVSRGLSEENTTDTVGKTLH